MPPARCAAAAATNDAPIATATIDLAQDEWRSSAEEQLTIGFRTAVEARIMAEAQASAEEQILTGTCKHALIWRQKGRHPASCEA